MLSTPKELLSPVICDPTALTHGEADRILKATMESARLNTGEKYLVVSCYLQTKIKDAAKVLGISEQTAWTALSRARTKMQKRTKQEDLL